MPTVSYEIYVNLAADDKATPQSKSYLGVLGLFGTQHGHAHEHRRAGGHAEVFDVTKFISDSTQALQVTFVPIPLLVAKNPHAIVRQAVKAGAMLEAVSMGALQIVAIEGSKKP